MVILAAILALFLLLIPGCEYAGRTADTLNTTAQQVEQYAKDHPAIDSTTSGGISAAALLLYSAAATVGLFRKSKTANDMAEILEDVLTANPDAAKNLSPTSKAIVNKKTGVSVS